jgi:hypothetical protein
MATAGTLRPRITYHEARLITGPSRRPPEMIGRDLIATLIVLILTVSGPVLVSQDKPAEAKTETVTLVISGMT